MSTEHTLEQTQAWVESNRKNRAAMKDAHNDGRHGDPEVRDLVEYWSFAGCDDCDAVRRYNGWTKWKRYQ